MGGTARGRAGKLTAMLKRRKDAERAEASTESEEEAPAPRPQRSTRGKTAVTAPARGRGGGRAQPQGRGTMSRAPQSAAPVPVEESSEEDEDSEPSGPEIDWNRAISNAIALVLVAQRKKIPLKKSDFIKEEIWPKRSMREGLYKLQEALEVFGFELYAIKQDKATGHWKEVLQFEEGSHFLIGSKFAKGRLGRYGVGVEETASEQDVLKGCVVGVILNTLYLYGREVDEDYLWNSLGKVGDVQKVCGTKEDFAKFLKAELVNTMYVHCGETKTPDGPSYRYSWGIRAEIECDKLEMLKHLAVVYKKPMEAFTKLYEDVVNDADYNYRLEHEKKRLEKQQEGASNSDSDHAAEESSNSDLEDAVPAR